MGRKVAAIAPNSADSPLAAWVLGAWRVVPSRPAFWLEELPWAGFDRPLLPGLPELPLFPAALLRAPSAAPALRPPLSDGPPAFPPPAPLLPLFPLPPALPPPLPLPLPPPFPLPPALLFPPAVPFPFPPLFPLPPALPPPLPLPLPPPFPLPPALPLPPPLPFSPPFPLPPPLSPPSATTVEAVTATARPWLRSS